MKSAQIKKSLTIVGVIALLASLAVVTPKVLAQEATNPFTPTPVSEELTPPPLLEQAELLNDAETVQQAFSQDIVSLTAIPPRLGDDGTLTGAPGEVLQVQLRVRNLTEATIPVVTTIQDFILDPDGETQ